MDRGKKLILTDYQTETRWVKFREVKWLEFVGKDVLAFSGGGRHIVFYNLNDKSDICYEANGEATGEGIECIAAYRSAYMFALAEKTPNPRILLFRYPSFNRIQSLEDAEQMGRYVNIQFTDAETLVALTGLPTFEIVIWCWRTGVQLAKKSTEFFNTDIIMRCNYTSPILVAQVEDSGSTESRLQLWEVNMCAKQCVVTKWPIKLPEKLCIADASWGPDDFLYIVDACGNFLLLYNETSELNFLARWQVKEESMSSASSLGTWFKNWFVVAGPNSLLQSYRRVAADWQAAWNVMPISTVCRLVSNMARDTLIGFTVQGELIQITFDQLPRINVLKYYGSGIVQMALVRSVGYLIATVNTLNELFILKDCGEVLGKLELGHYPTLIVSHPTMPYLLLNHTSGIMDLVSVDAQYTPKLHAQLYLCREELTGVEFAASGTLIIAAAFKVGRIFLIQCNPGQSLNVAVHELMNEEILEMCVVAMDDGTNECLITVVGYGKQFCIHSLSTLKVEQRLDLDVTYTCLMQATMYRFLAVPQLSRQIHIFSINSETQSIDLESVVCTDHQVRGYQINGDKFHFITFGWDGLVLLYNVDNMETFGAFIAHSRFSGGIKHAIVTTQAEWVFSLGRDGNLVCTKIIFDCGHSDEEHASQSESFHDTDIVHGQHILEKSWLEIQDHKQMETERQMSSFEVKTIGDEFRQIQNELLKLLDQNEEMPREEKLEILDFDLDSSSRALTVEEVGREREMVKIRLEEEIEMWDNLAQVIRSECWDKMAVQTRRIMAIHGTFDVENYGLVPQDPEFKKRINIITENRKLEDLISKDNTFTPWVPTSESVIKMQLTVKPRIQEMDDVEKLRRALLDAEEGSEFALTNNIIKEDPYVLSGSSSHKFVDVSPYLRSQFEMSNYFQAITQIPLLEKTCLDLRLYFNKLFDEMFTRKELAMAILKERNNRLRTMLYEFRVTCKTPSSEPEPIDPDWSPLERPHTIIKVEDWEVPVRPYISPSQQALMEQKAAEEERIRLLLAADNFPEQALIKMMDGVLEVRWEDELKKEVPLPRCMTEKEPETYNEDDLRAIKDYEDKVKTLHSERERYRKMLDQEWIKLNATIKESIKTFDDRLHELLITRIKIEESMNQEMLKCVMITALHRNKINAVLDDKKIRNKIKDNEKRLADTNAVFAKLQEATNECRTLYDTLVHRDKTLEKKFKSEFQNTTATVVVMEPLKKLLKRRPKMQQRSAMCPTALRELGRCLVKSDTSSFLPSECSDYFRSMEILDNYTNAPVNVDENVWAIFVRVRRAKIESELKMKACALDLAEAEATLSHFLKVSKDIKDDIVAHNATIKTLREKRLTMSHEIDFQLIMKSGLVEVPCHGEIANFQNTVLLNRSVIEYINRLVSDAGAKKLAAMYALTNFHRQIIYKEWEHQRIKMQIEDLKERIKSIESLRVSYEIKDYLRQYALKGPPTGKGAVAAEKELANIRLIEEYYKKLTKEVDEDYKDVEEKIKCVVTSGFKLDKAIEEINVDIKEQQLQRDFKFAEKRERVMEKRRMMIVKRAQLVAQVQKNHSENLILQAELELLRLKTYPTLKFKAIF